MFKFFTIFNDHWNNNDDGNMMIMMNSDDHERVVCFVLFCFVHVRPATSTYDHMAHVPSAGGAQPAITAHMARLLYGPLCVSYSQF